MNRFLASIFLPEGSPTSSRLEKSNWPFSAVSPDGSVCLFYSSNQRAWIQTGSQAAYWVALVGRAVSLRGLFPEGSAVGWLVESLAGGKGLESALGELDGEFAVLVWDANSRRAFLASDRVGHRTIYYSRTAQGGLACSSHAALAARATGRLAVDPQGLNLYLALRGVPAPYCLLQGVRKAVPGQLHSFSVGSESTSTWWDPAGASGSTIPYDLDEAGLALQSALATAISRSLPPENKGAGIFLSGGLDSSILASVAVRQGSALDAFSVGYTPAFRTDETRYAEQAAQQMELPLQIERFSIRELENLFEYAVPNLSEPVADPSFWPQLYLSGRVPAHVSMMLDGTGADGLFGGSNKFLAQSYRRIYHRLPALVRRGLVRPLVGTLPASRRWRVTNLIRKAQFFLAASELDDLAAEILWSQLMPKQAILHLLKPEWRVEGNRATSLLQQELQRFSGDHELAGVALMNLRQIQPWYELHKHNTIETLTDLSIRKPFLSPEVISLALSLPDDFKVRGRQGKYILYRTFAQTIPPQVLERPKSNFSPPVSLWLAKAFGNAFEEMVNQSVFFDQIVLRRMAREQASGWRDWQTELWAIFVLECWWKAQLLERNIDDRNSA